MAAELAPRWHTAALVALIVAVPIAGLLLQPAQTLEPEHSLCAYLTAIFAQIVLVAYVARVGRDHSVLGSLVGKCWTDKRRVAGDLLSAFILVITIVVLETLYRAWRGDATGAMPPRSGLEHAAWIVVAVVVGCGEEIVYRGYLQSQLAGWAGNRPAAGIIGQAALFGFAHADQGASAASRVGVYGALFGLVALKRRSLVACMLAHVLIDVAAAS